MCLPFLVCPTKSNPDNNHCCGDLKNTEKYVMKSVVTNQSTCWDNAPVERFFDSLKREWTGDRSYRTRPPSDCRCSGVSGSVLQFSASALDTGLQKTVELRKGP